MNVQLKPFDFASAVAKAGLRPDGTSLRAPAVAPAAVDAPSFSAAMAQALKSVSDSQLEVQGMQQELQLDNPTVSIEQTVNAMNRSQIGFQAALSVRNRLVQAYSDIMNMQV